VDTQSHNASMSNPNRHSERLAVAHFAPGMAWECAGAGMTSCVQPITQSSPKRGVLSMA
jgi:hypothetical protein